MFDTRFLIGALALFLFAGCSGSALDATTPLGKRAVLDAVNNALSNDDCSTAVTLVEPSYKSVNSDNDIRLAMAAAYACHARVKLFSLIQDLATNQTKLATGEFWGLLPQLFPSTIADRIPEAGNLAADALMASTLPGWPLIPAYQFYIDTTNPGSLIAGDRITDANLFLIFTSMATIGGYNNRFGVPDPNSNYDQTAKLPWSTVATVDRDGCAYAAAVINMVDALELTADAATGNLKTSLTSISAAFSSGIKQACDDGCQNTDPAGPVGASGCATTTPCANCPLLLRNRDTCFDDTADAKCAAAGIVNFINDMPVVGWAGS